MAAGTDLPDAASGFRAYSRECLMRLNTVTRFSYCMETIIQAGNKKLKIDSIPVVTNPKTRESRLFTITRQHVFKSGGGDHPRLHHVQAVRHLRLVGGRCSPCSGLLPVRPVRRAGRRSASRAAATCSRCWSAPCC